MFKYSINLAWSDEDECYVATIPELPGLSAFGDTPEEAVAEAKVAADGYIETLKEDGEKIPEPQKVKRFSGQTRLRLPLSLHERLSKEAEKEGVSLNSYMLFLLSSNLSIRIVNKQLANIQKKWVRRSISKDQRVLGTVKKLEKMAPRPYVMAEYSMLASNYVSGHFVLSSRKSKSKEVTYAGRE